MKETSSQETTLVAWISLAQKQTTTKFQGTILGRMSLELLTWEIQRVVLASG